VLTIVNPASGEVIDEIAGDSRESVLAKLRRARSHQRAWARAPLSARLESMRAFVELLRAETESLARLLTSETGKPVAQSRNELNAMPERVGYFIDHAAAVLADEVVLTRKAPAAPGQPPSTEELIRYEPLGTVANISAWNYPYFVGSNVFVPALLAGNSVLYKPSEYATLTGLAIADLMHRAGVPEDAFIPVIGNGTTGAALVEAAVDGIFFTGSFATGRRIAQAAAGRMIPVQLELGGKDPVYITEDVDVEAAAAAMAEGAFYNNGQSCCAVERIYVHERIAEPFIGALVEEVAKLRVGDPMDADTFIGPLARQAQLDVLEHQVADALARGGEVLQGGHRLDRAGWYFEPTVIGGATHEMKVMKEESFGPIIGVQSVANDARAIAMMNDTDYGLTAGVYARDQGRAESILSEVDSGTAYWNCCDRVSPRLPWTGRKHSGIGSTLSTAGIRAFARPKAYHLREPAGA
jgi:acyl-CoA reductase-like NAD-dependent aldehyde dehydrogenase